MNILKRLASGLVPLVLCAVTSLSLAQPVSSDATDTDPDHLVDCFTATTIITIRTTK